MIWFLLAVIVIAMVALDSWSMDIRSPLYFSGLKARVDKGIWTIDHINVIFATAYETWEEFEEKYIEGEYYAQLPDELAKHICQDAFIPSILSIFLPALLISLRYADDSLALACRSGRPRWKVITAALLWFYGMVFLIMWLAILVSFSRILLFSRRLPSAAYWPQLLLLRPLSACGCMSVPALIAVALKKIHWSALAGFAWMMLNAAGLGIEPIRWLNPLKYAYQPEIWAIPGDLPRTLEMIGFTLAVMLVFGVLTALVFRKKEIK